MLIVLIACAVGILLWGVKLLWFSTPSNVYMDVSPMLSTRGADTAGLDSVATGSMQLEFNKAKKSVLAGDYDEAKKTYLKIVNSYTDDSSKEDAELCALSLNNLSYIDYFINHKYDVAYLYLAHALDICMSRDLSNPLPIIYLNLGNLYAGSTFSASQEQLLPIARNLYKTGLKKAVEISNDELVLKFFVNLCSMANSKKDFQELQTEADIVSKRHFSDSVINRRFVNVLIEGVNEVNAKNTQKAIGHFKNLTSLIDDPNNRAEYEGMSLSLTSRAYAMEQMYDSAIMCDTRLLALAKANSIPNLEYQALQSLEDNQRLANMADEAKQTHLAMLVLSDSLQKSNQFSSLMELHFMHGLQRQEMNVQKLTGRNKMLSLSLIAAAVLILLVTIFTWIIMKKNRELHERNRDLYVKNVKLMKLEKEIDSKEKEEMKLNDNLVNTLLPRIRETLADEKIICSENFSLSQLARIVNSNTSYVSKIINEHYGCGFAILLGDLRAKVVCRRIDSPDKPYDKFTIETIANDVGFKSRASLTAAMKRVTGLTPTEYIRQANDNKQSLDKESVE